MASIPPFFLQTLFAEAEHAYPAECCGMLLGLRGKKGFSRIRSFGNAQDRFHEKDPAQFPRTSRSAYFIDPGELLTFQKKMRESGEEIRMIYHSHIDAPAYFSEEDRRMALWSGDPVYPEAGQLVISVIQKKAVEGCLYRWDAHKKDFLAVERMTV